MDDQYKSVFQVPMVPILSMIRSYELDLDGKVSIVVLVNRLQVLTIES